MAPPHCTMRSSLAAQQDCKAGNVELSGRVPRGHCCPHLPYPALSAAGVPIYKCAVLNRGVTRAAVTVSRTPCSLADMPPCLADLADLWRRLRELHSGHMRRVDPQKTTRVPVPGRGQRRGPVSKVPTSPAAPADGTAVPPGGAVHLQRNQPFQGRAGGGKGAVPAVRASRASPTCALKTLSWSVQEGRARTGSGQGAGAVPRPASQGGPHVDALASILQEAPAKCTAHLRNRPGASARVPACPPAPAASIAPSRPQPPPPGAAAPTLPAGTGSWPTTGRPQRRAW